MENQKLFCPNCGTANDMSAAFCQNCGQDLSQVKAEVLAAQKAKNEADQEAIYLQANQMADAGKVSEAATLFERLGSYKDAQEKATANRVLADAEQQKAFEQQRSQQYDAAMAAFNQGDLQQAAAVFSQLGDYKDAKDKLALVQNALSQQQQQLQAQNYEQAYQATLSQAQAAKNSSALRVALTDLARFAGYKDADQQRANLEAKMPTMLANEEVQHTASRKRFKVTGLITAVVVVLIAIGGGIYAYQAHQATVLNAQVASQRSSNAKSFNDLPNA